jgi:electron transport complex protein RnfA
MITTGHLLSLSIIAVLIDRFVLDRCLGKGDSFRNENTFKRSLSLGGCVSVVLVCATVLAGLAMDFVLMPLGLDYLLSLVFVVIIAALSLAAEFLFSAIRPFVQLHRLFSRTSALCAILVLPLLAPFFNGFAQQPLPLKKCMILGGTAGIAFTTILLLFSGIMQTPLFGKISHPRQSLSLELVTGALLLLAFAGISSCNLLPW